jgi:hypothetical protein
MVPFTIFHRLSSLGSGGGVNAGTNPPFHEQNAQRFRRVRLGVYLSFTAPGRFESVTTVTCSRNPFIQRIYSDAFRLGKEKLPAPPAVEDGLEGGSNRPASAPFIGPD